jgi:excisionase family DNA binding protein
MSEKDRLRKGNSESDVRVAPAPIEIEPLWTVMEVADFLRLRPETVRSMARRQEIPSVRIRRRWRFRRQDIEHWVQTMSDES